MRYCSLVLLVTCLVAAGCNDSGFPLVELSGIVRFDGGPPPRSGSIMFSPVAGTAPEGLPSRPAVAPFGEDGKFRATSWKKNDGILPGRYTVRVYCMDPGPDPAAAHDDFSLVPDGWEPEGLVVEEGQGPIHLEIDVPANK